MKTYALALRGDEASRAIGGQLQALLTARGWRQEQEHPACVIVAGGDGTFLRAVHARLADLEDCAFVGVHTGTLGFLMDYQGSELSLLAEDLDRGLLWHEHRPLLTAESENICLRALNEIRIENPVRTQKITVRMNGEYFEDFRGTGICICTQLGSTALNRSLGGAVVQNGLPALQLTEIAGIHHSVYRSLGAPFVFAQDTVVELESESFDGALLGADDAALSLSGALRIRVCTDPQQRVRILRRPGVSFYRRLARLL